MGLLALSAWLLAALAVLLAGPAPMLLARAQWPRSSPVAGLLLWQTIGLAGGLSMIGALLLWGLSPLGENLFSGLTELWRILGEQAPNRLDFWHILALACAALLSIHLVFNLILSYLRIRTQRRQHREFVQLLSTPSPETGALVLEHPAPVAYCLPGSGGSVTVLSRGLIELLEPAELQAVLAHENSHLAQRHDLLTWAFAAWRAALPWLPTTKDAQSAVNSLVEMLADDDALHSVPREDLAAAISKVAVGSRELTPEESGTSGHRNGGELLPLNSTSVTVQRVQRLLEPQVAKRGLGLSAILGALALLLLPTALLFIPNFL